MSSTNTSNLNPIRGKTKAFWTASLSLAVFSVTSFAGLTALDLGDVTIDVTASSIFAYSDYHFGHSGVFRGMLSLFIGGIGGLATYTAAKSRAPLVDPFTQETDADPHVYYTDDARNNLRSRMIAEAGRGVPDGIYLCPHLPMPFSAETKNIMVLGSPNSGKSNIIRAIADQMIERGDRTVILCVKGEYTAAFDSQDSILIGAHLEGSHALDLAADITNSAAATQFAADIIPQSDPPFWSDCVRAVLTDIILHLQERRPGKWTAATLLGVITKSSSELRRRIANMRFNVGTLLESADEEVDDKTVTGILLTLRSAAYANLRPLAWAWGHMPPEQRFSVKRWLSDGYKGTRTVIVQFSSEYEAISSLVVGYLLRTISRNLIDPQLSKDSKRRVALILDEFHEINRIEGFTHTMSLGRENGLVVVLGCQTYQHIVEKYGREDAAAINDLFLIKIFGVEPPGASSEHVQSLLGTRKIVRLVPNRTPAKDDTRSEVELRETIPAFSTTRMASQLGVTKSTNQWATFARCYNWTLRFLGFSSRFTRKWQLDENDNIVKITAVVQSYGQVYVLEWPLTTWAERRPRFIPAGWLSQIPQNP